MWILIQNGIIIIQIASININIIFFYLKIAIYYYLISSSSSYFSTNLFYIPSNWFISIFLFNFNKNKLIIKKNL